MGARIVGFLYSKATLNSFFFSLKDKESEGVTSLIHRLGYVKI